MTAKARLPSDGASLALWRSGHSLKRTTGTLTGDFALVLQSSHAAEAYNCADSQYQVLFERKHVRILGVIEAYLGDCFALYDPAWNWLTSTEVSWKTLRRHVEKLAASKAAVLV